MKQTFNLLVVAGMLVVGMMACKSTKKVEKKPQVNVVQVPSAPDLAWPENGSKGQTTSLSVNWSPAAGAKTYHLQVASDSSFSSTVSDQNDLSSTSAKISGLDHSTTYYWRVNASNSGGTGPWSNVWSFTTAAPPPPPAPPKIELQTIHFNFDKSNIGDHEASLLSQNVSQLRNHPKLNVTIDAYTDHIGGDQYNLRLSIRRADAVKEFYTNNGIDASRITTRGLGKAPVACSAEQKAQTQGPGCRFNRRAESHINNQSGNP